MRTRLNMFGSTAVLTVSGRIDATSAPVLEQTLLATVDEKTGPIIVDMSEVDYVSSAGLNVTLLAAKALAKTSRQLVVAGVNDDVADVMRLTGVDKLIMLSESLDAAIDTAGGKP